MAPLSVLLGRDDEILSRVWLVYEDTCSEY